MRFFDQGRGRTGISIAFACCAVGAMVAQLTLDNQAGPCNPNDFNGCSAVGELAVFAWLLLVPATVVLALIRAVLLVADRSDE